MTAIRWLHGLAVTALVMGSVSCGLFETRDPQEPEQPDQDCLPLTNTATVTRNIETAYGRNALVTCYSSLIDPAFLFHPDAQDSLQNPLPFVGWNDQVEISHNSQVATLQTFIDVDFQREYQSAIISPDQTTEVRFYEYLLRVGGLVPSDTTIARYTGLADITFRRGSDGQWKVVDWADHRGTVSDSTWGLLRSNHRTGP